MEEVAKRWLVHRSVAVLPTTSTLPVGDATDFDMGYSQSEATLDLCVNVFVRPTRTYFAAPVRGRRAV